jgi:3-oxoacyl-[acyl-carrier-protein] synthase-1
MLTYYHHDRMLKLGPARCSPLGIVASIVGTLNFNLVAAFKIQGPRAASRRPAPRRRTRSPTASRRSPSAARSGCSSSAGEDGNRDAILPFAGMRTLSLQTDPALASRPFDVARDGFVGTGGGVVLVLESEEEVSRRGVTPYCELVGWGQASDGYNVAISHPDGTGSRRGDGERASPRPGLPAAVDYVNAHATSTLIGDISEARALRSVFGEMGIAPGSAAPRR